MSQLSFFINVPRLCSQQSNNVKHSKDTNIIFNMTMFCDEEETNTFGVPNE